MILSAFEIFLGLVALYFGSEFLVKGSSKVASAFGVRPIIIGLTFVAFGTSSPEFMVSLLAVLQGHPSLCVGNIVGSNIANIGLILGVAAMTKPNPVDKRVIKLDMPLVLIFSIILWLISLDGELTRIDGIIFVACLGVYLIHAFRSGQEKNLDLNSVEAKSKAKNMVIAVVGLIILIAGGQFLVHGAVTIARNFGISELVIGLTVVAFGTSLPELATAIYASLTDKASISVGNIVGSNLFNILFVVGAIVIICPLPVSHRTIVWDMPVMIFLAVFTYVLMIRKQCIGRPCGFVLLLIYICYIGLMFFYN